MTIFLFNFSIMQVFSFYSSFYCFYYFRSLHPGLNCFE